VLDAPPGLLDADGERDGETEGERGAGEGGA
jgi:hypothetical protein